MKPMLIIHIGWQKTGTTAIQNFLKSNAGILRRNGWNFLTAGRTNISHNSLISPLRKGKAQATIDEIAAEVMARPDLVHILSSEMLSEPGLAAKLRQALPNELASATKVIAYLRRPDKYAEAMYKQKVKNARTDPDPIGFLERFKGNLLYSKVLDQYADAFGESNVVALPFELELLENGDVVADFCTQIGIKDFSPYEHSQKMTNKSLSAAMSEMLGLVKKHSEANTRVMIREISAEGVEHAIRSNDVFERPTRRDIQAETRDDQNQWQARFCDGKTNLFSEDDLLNTGPDKYPTAQEQVQLYKAAAAIAIEKLSKQSRKRD